MGHAPPEFVSASICSRPVLPGVPGLTVASTFGGGGGTSVQSMFARIKCPRCTGEDWSARPWPNKNMPSVKRPPRGEPALRATLVVFSPVPGNGSP